MIFAHWAGAGHSPRIALRIVPARDSVKSFHAVTLLILSVLGGGLRAASSATLRPWEWVGSEYHSLSTASSLGDRACLGVRKDTTTVTATARAEVMK